MSMMDGDEKKPLELHPMEDTQLIKDDIPPDRMRLVYLLYFIMGTTCMLPFNFIVQATQYFNYRFRDLNTTYLPHNTSTFDILKKTELQSVFEASFSVVGKLSLTVGVVSTLLLIQRFSLKKNVVGSIIVQLVILTGFVALTQTNTDQWQKGFFALTMSVIVVLNLFNAIFSSGILGLAALFPPVYLQAVEAGMGFGGFAASITNIATISVGKDPQLHGLFYFIIADLALLISVLSFCSLDKFKYANYYLPKTVSFSGPQIDKDKGLRYIWSVVKKIWKAGISELLVYMITLSVYPGVLADLDPMKVKSGEYWSEVYFTPVACFLVFTSFDLMGRMCVAWIQYPKLEQSSAFIVISVCRILFVPLLTSCNIHTDHVRNLPVAFQHDSWPIIFIALLAFTNGYFGTLWTVYGPQFVSLRNEKTTAGVLMSLFKLVGFCIGSFLSVAIVKLI